MHRGLIFLQLSSWFASIHALVPYASSEGYGRNVGRSAPGANPVARGGFVTFKLVQTGPDSDDPPAGMVSRDAQGQAYGRRSIWSRIRKAAVSERDNDWTILNAVEPTVDNSARIEQDGTDYSYFVEAKLGSDGKPLYMLLDTGASTTWVMGSGCTSDACKSHSSYGPNDSKTYLDTGKTYSVEYGTGSVSGHVITDTMSIAGLSATVSFGVANTTSDEFSEFPFDGILGLSMSPDTWLTAIKNASLIDANIFGISLARAADGTNDGEIAFGAPNPEKMEGDITYTPLKAGSTWTITMDGATVDGKAAGFDSRDAYIDTGTSFIFGPPNDVKAIYGMIPDSAQQDSATWSIPCDSNVPVALTFSGTSWTISSKDFVSGPNSDGVCTGKIYGMEYVKGAWLVGDTFLKNVYSVYDMDQRRIGFAAKAPASNSTQDTSNSTTPTSTAGTSTSTGSSTTSGAGLNGHETTTADSSSSGEMLVAGSQLAFVIFMISAIAMIT
ncbi:acid protease [Camillea tinctor]|nr:acid protease [Camillea tinctor]